MKFTEKRDLPVFERLLEFKSFNRHAAIYRLDADFRGSSGEITPTRIRNRIKEITKPNVFRGLAFGAHIVVGSLPENIDDFFEAIDIRQKERSVWQWTIFEIKEPKIVVALHTWMQVWLTGVFEVNLSELEEAGYPIERFKRQKEKLMRILTALQPNYKFPEHQAPNK